MAAMTTTYFEAGRSWGARVAERNAELLAQQALRRRGVRTPEFLLSPPHRQLPPGQGPDPVRVREMRIFCAAICILFTLVMVYGLQHFSAIEGGYRVESEKQMRDQLLEENRQLRLPKRNLRSRAALTPWPASWVSLSRSRAR